MKIFKKLIIAVCLLCICFASCELFCYTENLVFVSHKVVVGEMDNEYKYAGAVFKIFNKSNVDVVEVEFEFNLYENDTKNERFISHVKTKCSGLIESGDEKTIAVSLDDYVGGVLMENYSVSQIFITKIIYENGEEWKAVGGWF